LPQGTQIPNLPALYGLWSQFEASVWGQIILEGPAADTGPIGVKLKTPE